MVLSVNTMFVPKAETKKYSAIIRKTVPKTYTDIKLSKIAIIVVLIGCKYLEKKT